MVKGLGSWRRGRNRYIKNPVLKLPSYDLQTFTTGKRPSFLHVIDIKLSD